MKLADWRRVSRRGMLWAGAGMIALAAGLLIFARFSQVQPAMEFRGSLVVLDPGHGGKDPGASGKAGVREKDVTLAVAQLLEPLFNRAGVYTLLTRRGDYDLADPDARPRKPQDLRRRAQMANDAGAHVFISIHANSVPSSIWRGAQTFYFPGKPESERLAGHIQAALRREVGPNERQARPGRYRVLSDTTMPAVVVELGFLSHPEEEQLLAQREYQEKLARAIYAGVLAYLMGAPLAEEPPLSR